MEVDVLVVAFVEMMMSKWYTKSTRIFYNPNAVAALRLMAYNYASLVLRAMNDRVGGRLFTTWLPSHASPPDVDALLLPHQRSRYPQTS